VRLGSLWELVKKIRLEHIFRERNRCTYKLTDFACGLDGDFLMMELQPSFLSQLLISDALGVSTPGLVAV